MKTPILTITLTLFLPTTFASAQETTIAPFCERIQTESAMIDAKEKKAKTAPIASANRPADKKPKYSHRYDKQLNNLTNNAVGNAAKQAAIQAFRTAVDQAGDEYQTTKDQLREELNAERDTAKEGRNQRLAVAMKAAQKACTDKKATDTEAEDVYRAAIRSANQQAIQAFIAKKQAKQEELKQAFIARQEKIREALTVMRGVLTS